MQNGILPFLSIIMCAPAPDGFNETTTKWTSSSKVIIQYSVSWKWVYITHVKEDCSYGNEVHSQKIALAFFKICLALSNLANSGHNFT